MWSSNLDLYAQSAGRKTLHHPCSFSQKSQYLKILIPLSNDVITIYCCISYRLDYRCSLVSGLCSYLWGGGEYMAHIPKQQLIIMPISPTITFRKTICWPGMHDTLNSLPSWIQFLIHVLCFAGFVLPIRDVRASVGAGFLYPLVGTVCVFLTYFITSLLCNCYLGLSQHAHREGVCCMTSTKPYAVACIAHYCICW